MNMYTVQQHRQDLQQAILPLLDDILKVSFSRGIVSVEAYTQVIKCNSENKPRRFCLAIQQCVSRSAKNYDAFLKLLKEKLPKHHHSADLLRKSTLKKALSSFSQLSDCEGLRAAFSEPAMARRKPRAAVVNEQLEQTEEESKSDESEDEGLQFSVQCTEEVADSTKDHEQCVEPVEELGDNREREMDKDVPSNLKQRKFKKILDNDTTKVISESSPPNVALLEDERRGILMVLDRWRNSTLDCRQLEAEVLALNREVYRLKEKLVSVDNDNTTLENKLQRHSEEIERLRSERNANILALRETFEANERLKTKIAGVEADRHGLTEEVREIGAQRDVDQSDFDKQVIAITHEYEQKIKAIESKRRMDQERYDKALNVDIPKLQNVILDKEIKIDELNKACRFYNCVRYTFHLLIIIVVFLLLLYFYLRW